MMQFPKIVAPESYRWYQAEAIQSIFDYFESGKNGNPVIAMPTGSGKTHVISGFMRRVMQIWPNQRFMVATHVKELVEQNASKLAQSWPHAPYGINSAGLKRREISQPIIIGGVQSMYKAAETFGWRDLLIIDEAHLVSPNDDTMYQTLIDGLRAINPHLKVIGLSATIYRQKQGLITDKIEGGVFTDVCYDLCTMEGYARLIHEGYLAPLYPKRTSFEIDVSSVDVNNTGDFNQNQLSASTTDKVMWAALSESVQYGYNRRSWLVFASGIERAEKATEMLNQMGISAVCVHSKISTDERDARITAHKNGDVRAMVGNNIFTTGYDHPPLDFIIDLQPTMSVPKHVQKYGRLMRPSRETGKTDGLIMDFGGNTRRCGPINDPYIPQRSRKMGGDAPVKICDGCGTYNHASARFCISCGDEFEFQTKIVKSADEVEILKSDLPIIEKFPVDAVMYFKHVSKAGNTCLKVIYRSGLQMFTEWVFLELAGKKGKDARDWWRQRHSIEPPTTIDDALKYQAELRCPREINVWINKQYPEITSVIW